MEKRTFLPSAVLALALAGLTALFSTSCANKVTALAAPADLEGYSAVLLGNGQSYIGRLSGLGTAFPVLTDVYYIQARVDPETKQAVNTLIKRGKEWHAPERMLISANSIVFVEPVKPGSDVAKLIEKHRLGNR